MILHLLNKPARYEPLVKVDELSVSSAGILGGIPTPPIRQVLMVPQTTLERFRLSPGDLRENVVIDDSGIGPLHSLASGTVLKVGNVLVRLTVHCEPCGRLKGVVSIKAIEHKRGYLGSFLTSGRLTVGDEVVSLGIQYEPIPYDLNDRLAWFLHRQPAAIDVTTLVHEVGLSLSYCRAIPSLLRARPDLLRKVTFRGRAMQKVRRDGGRKTALSNQAPAGVGSGGAETSNTQAKSLKFIDGAFVVYLCDDRSFTVPLKTVPEIAGATAAQRCRWELTEQGQRIRWPSLDLEVKVSGLLGLPDV